MSHSRLDAGRPPEVCMNIIKNPFSLVLGCLELHPALFSQNTILAEIELACLDALQQASFIKLCHPTLAHVTQPHVPQGCTALSDSESAAATPPTLVVPNSL